MLLTVPVIGLALFGMILSRQKPTLVLNSVRVTRLTPTAPNKANPNPPDTSWIINLSYNRGLFPANRYIDVKVAYIEDAQGKQYTRLKGQSRGMNLANEYQLKLLPSNTYQIAYAHNLAQIPESAGKLTFKALYSAANGSELPVSAVVRQ